MTTAAGIDGCPQGWVAVVLEDGAFVRAHIGATLAGLVAELPDVAAIGVDMPIGLPDGLPGWPRKSDLLARGFVGPRWPSVFLTLPRATWQAGAVEEAKRISLELTGHAFAAQTWALRDRIFQADEAAHADARIHEIHPEVSFAELAGCPLRYPKSTWAGIALRRRLLADHGIEIPDDLGRAGVAKVDDVLDAAAGAWSADRIARGVAIAMPDPPERMPDGLVAAIWR